MGDTGRILVLYGSQTFTAQEVAERIWRSTKVLGFRGPVKAMDDYPISKLIHEEFAIFVCATTGQGDQPDNMKKFWKFLLRRNLPSNSLVKLKFGVLGLGDSSYAKFNFVGKLLHKRLLQLGATPLLDIGLCDYQHDLGHDGVIIPWIKNYFSHLQTYFPNIKTVSLTTNFTPRWKVSLLKNAKSESIDDLNNDIYFSKGCKDEFLDSRLLEIEKNERTTHTSHFQDVRLVTLKITDSTKLEYKPGDVFNIRPRNSKEDIDDIFGIFETHSIDIKPHYRLMVEEFHDDMLVPEFLQTPLTMYEIAEQYWDLKAYPTQYVFSLLALISEDKLEREKCLELSSPEGQEDWLNYCRRPKRTILEVLHDFHKSASKLTIEYLFELFSTIKPRSFSIASSCLPSASQKLDLLMAVVNYHTKLKKARLGLCSNWLASLNVGDRVYGWIKDGSLKFPEPTTPHILIGPGTGLAPFRSLIQEYEFNGTLDKENLHLFFGCRYKEKDFHCREEWERLVDEGKLTLYGAFSRDQDNKIYVQHKIAEHGDKLWPLISKRNAHVYISGNAKNMPDNVKDAFVDIFKQNGNLPEDKAKEMLGDIEKNGRLQVEAW
ncbi:NADPH-dependent diflavin oxidoreductase 1 [Ostrinia furnacalis]|uniref:NADPH-dependent diflavin oxidoreductase 1 n=1 Tax=Ostrinia furnacalis TaxID=93504 RepID=UPI00103D4F33|nr:NADPH-dependent diflavin oxidoreductase 1 [Ostrinia furnacalis]XP_028164713.1 NADPH-dependent diflavin oxidoreductase 1 [Ostrinia furnacalis]